MHTCHKCHAYVSHTYHTWLLIQFTHFWNSRASKACLAWPTNTSLTESGSCSSATLCAASQFWLCTYINTASLGFLNIKYHQKYMMTFVYSVNSDIQLWHLLTGVLVTASFKVISEPFSGDTSSRACVTSNDGTSQLVYKCHLKCNEHKIKTYMHDRKCFTDQSTGILPNFRVLKCLAAWNAEKLQVLQSSY